LGRQIARMSAQLQASSHKEVLRILFGHKAGAVMDILLTFFLYGVGVAMLAGTGSLFQQQFGFSPIVGGAFMAGLVILALCLNVKRIIDLVSAATPILRCMVIIITVYSLFTVNACTDELLALAHQQGTVAPHWSIAAMLY